MYNPITYYTEKGRFEVQEFSDIPYEKLHNASGPALIISGRYTWYYHGKIHRDDGPAVMDWSLDLKEVWKHGHYLGKIKDGVFISADGESDDVSVVTPPVNAADSMLQKILEL